MFALVVVSLSNCTKAEDVILLNKQSTKEMQTAIVGSWLNIEKGVEMTMHDGHICTNSDNNADDKTTIAIKWANTASDEKRHFEQNGDYNSYVKTTLRCQGTYKIAGFGGLHLNTTCQNWSEKIVEVSSTLLIIKEGDSYFKYRKTN